MEYFASHPNLDMLELYLLKQLDQEDHQIVVEHLKKCARCRKMAGKLSEQIELIREALLVA